MMKNAVFTFRGEGTGDVDTISSAAQRLSQGISTQWMHDLGVDVYDELIAPKIVPTTLSMIKQHQAQGHDVWLISATPEFLAGIIARRLGLSGACGTRSEERDGVYTGKIIGRVMHGEEKKIAASFLADQYGYTLTECYGYSDSHSDIPLLQAVGHPTAMFPDKKLAKFAKEQGWPIFTETGL
jgi:HAD superfamily hydrolase (TIGR01490 family)